MDGGDTWIGEGSLQPADGDDRDLLYLVRILRDGAGRVQDLEFMDETAELPDISNGEPVVRGTLSAMLPRDAAPDAQATLEVVADAIGRMVGSVTAGPSGDEWRDVVDAGTGLSPLSTPNDSRLREYNHRVLNSLAMISSIIGMEARALQDDAGRAALQRVRSRLVAVSNLYRILSGVDGTRPIRADLYLQSVADAVAASVGLSDRIEVVVRSVRCAVPAGKVVALGLIANEAMTNAYKHAFAGRDRGRITLTLTNDAGSCTLSISDDGCGTRSERPVQEGLGTTLVTTLAADLGGEAQTLRTPAGTTVEVRFPAAG